MGVASQLFAPKMTNKNLTQFVLRKVKRRNRYCVLLTKLGTIVLTDQNDLACYRLLRPLAAAVFMGTCLASAAPPAMAQCRDGWCRAACTKSGRCNYVKVITRKYPYVIYLGNDSKGMYKLQSDCKKSRTIILEINGTQVSSRWIQMKPGSRGESIIKAACKM